MLIDLHAHYIPREILREAQPNEAWRPRVSRDEKGQQWVEHKTTKTNSAPREFVDIQRIIEEQDAAGVDVVALSPWTPLLNYELTLDEGQRSCELQNDALAQVVQAFPNRIAGLGCVPLQDAHVAARAAAHLVRDLGLHGIEIGTNVNGAYPGDEQFLPFWQVVSELDTLVFIHPVSGIGGPLMREYEFWNLYGNPAETGLAAASLIFGGVLERFSNLKILLAHGGGVLPYIIGRFDRGWQMRPSARKSQITRAPGTFLKQFYFDTITHSADALRYLIQVVGAEHVVIGSDYPFDMGYDKPRALVNDLGLTREQSEMIFSGTAARLLKLKQMRAQEV
ncbi:MAG TPA: amidohydrolase family protein [Anaerolineae bacterium]